MSDGDRQQRPKSGESARPNEAGDESFAPRDGAHPLASREERIAAEQPRARYQRMMEERGAIANSLAHRMTVMRKASGDASGKPAIPSAGGALDGRTRQTMERELGAPLGDVKVGTGGESATAAKQLGARAFTVGNEVHFGEGEYSPGTRQGDQLLAHELTHVVQGQRAGIQRKAEGGEEHDGPEVSNPEEPAEVEADAVSEDVADKLHGGGGGKDEKDEKKKGARPGKEAAPAVAAKLDSALKIFRAGGKKRGDHVFNNGLGKALGDMSAVAAGSVSSGGKTLSASLTAMQTSVSTDAFHITVDKGAGPAAGDENSQLFGKAVAATMAAFRAFIRALEGAESAPAGSGDKEQKALATAATALEGKFADMVANAFDAAAAALASKSDKKLIATGQATLKGLSGVFTAAVTSATTSAAPKKDAAGGGKPPKK